MHYLISVYTVGKTECLELKYCESVGCVFVALNLFDLYCVHVFKRETN